MPYVSSGHDRERKTSDFLAQYKSDDANSEYKNKRRPTELSLSLSST